LKEYSALSQMRAGSGLEQGVISWVDAGRAATRVQHSSRGGFQFYRLPNGKSPIEEFLDSLNGKQAQKVLWVLRLIEDLPVVPIQYFKKLTGAQIWEVRVQSGNDIFRLARLL